ncbi:MAG: Peptidase, partial [Verrucomicrobiaceae bacterium]|nr:Peptidase [Verrucomicrobiaceae bacterium]
MANTSHPIVFARRAAIPWMARLFAAAMVMTVSLMVAPAKAADMMRCALCDGFDHAVGKPNATGYYKSRGFSPNGHMGEDWNGNGGGDTDLGDPVYAIGNGVVVHAMDIHVGWGNVVIIRHAFRDETGKIQFVDSLYGHLNEIKVKMNQLVKRGEQVGTIGTNHGMYPAHLHLEVHKNLTMGAHQTGFAHDYSNYYSPTQFIESHRTLAGSFARVEVPIQTFPAYGEPFKAGTQGTGLGENPASATKISAHSLSIPVYRGSGAPVASSYGPGTSLTRPAPAAPSATPAPPAMIIPSETDDFWGRVKSKLKNGKIA